MRTSTKLYAAALLILIFFGYEASTIEKSPTTADLDEKAIQQVIAAETQAYVDRDSIALMSYYTDDDVTQSAWNNPNGSYSSLKGFDHIRDNFRAAFRKNPDRQQLPNIGRTDWYFRKLSDNWMWVNFMQKITLTNGKLYTSYETRLMKKEQSRWKIAVMYALSDHAVNSN